MHSAAVGFGSGLAKKAPGTSGTLAAVPFYYFMSFLSLQLYIAVIVICSVFGIWICQVTSGDMGSHDHGAIVSVMDNHVNGAF